MGNDNVILLFDACAVNEDAMLKLTDADPDDPTALLRVRALRLADTFPTAGVLICALNVSRLVLISNPPVAVPVLSIVTMLAADAAKVRPLHVTVIEPAGTATFTSMTKRLSLTNLLPSVTERVDGFGTISQLLAVSTAVTKPAGNVIDIFPSTANAVEVLKENDAV